MKRNQEIQTPKAAKQQTEDTDGNSFDLELASGYSTNSKLSLEIAMEFEAVDQEGDSRIARL